MTLKVEIYGRESCPYCTKAKELAHQLKSIGYIEDYVYHDYEKENIQKEFIQGIIGQTYQTVPVVILDGVYIGGYTNLKSRFTL